ncbi:SDR family NAD(P)-dependent oxidoreductase [Salirhabdus salicampi]|uniref:SDR family NAD(P)-dependent oxidoreductase n=1 Tax=Salirhabdus salicampi TaxID=476102 RepID=UPI0020C42E43|nr:SDR family oxidoreductase [Salirhabdus salicampi]MCP8616780.1 SDR family oxidoreductase [Salirhabdus salicampi]
MNLEKKNVVITGASSGIGERIALHVAAQGGTPILVARSEEKLQTMAKEIQSQHGLEAFVYRCDIGNRIQWEATLHRIVDVHEHIHVVINNAGFGLFERVTDMTMEQYDSMFQVNVLALIQSSRFFLSHMQERGEGHIVNIASQAAKLATTKAAGYAASKHAVLGFTNALRLEAEQDGVFVTAVNLGPVQTNFFSSADPSGNYERSVEKFMLHPDKVAERVVRALYHPIREINMPRWMDVGARLYQLWPSMLERLFKRQFQQK